MISGVSIAETTRAKKAFKESLTKQLDGERVCMQVGVYVNVVCNCCKHASLSNIFVEQALHQSVIT